MVVSFRPPLACCEWELGFPGYPVRLVLRGRDSTLGDRLGCEAEVMLRLQGPTLHSLRPRPMALDTSKRRLAALPEGGHLVIPRIGNSQVRGSSPLRPLTSTNSVLDVRRPGVCAMTVPMSWQGGFPTGWFTHSFLGHGCSLQDWVITRTPKFRRAAPKSRRAPAGDPPRPKPVRLVFHARTLRSGLGWRFCNLN